MAKIKAKEIEVANGKEQEVVEDIGIIAQIEKLKQSGQTNTDEFRQKARELEVLLGVNTINPFGTNELDLFQENLREMNFADMKKLAQRVGINPNYDRSTLKNILIKEFRATNRNNHRNIMPNQVNSIILDPNDPVQALALKILGEF
jgi:hypothetical protein